MEEIRDIDLDVVNFSKKIEQLNTAGLLYIRVDGDFCFIASNGVAHNVSQGLLAAMIRNRLFFDVIKASVDRYDEETLVCEYCGNVYHETESCDACKN